MNDRRPETADRGTSSFFGAALGSDNFNGVYWDPGRGIRSEIERTLASKPNTADFVIAAQDIASQFDVEFDRAAQDESRGRAEAVEANRPPGNLMKQPGTEPAGRQVSVH